MDLIIKNARLVEDPATLVDIGIEAGRFVAITPALQAEGETLDAEGRLVSPGFVETHLHLDKSCILDRCRAVRGDLAEAISETARVKKEFTAEDVYQRGRRTVEHCILQGTTHIRTHLEVDPGIGLRGLEGVLRLAEEYRWAIDIEICVFPQEGLLNNPGTEELMVQALQAGARVIGACPYTDSDPYGQIDRIFALARRFDVDIDMHLDFDTNPAQMDLDYVCRQAEHHRWGGRTAVGHVSKLAYLAPAALAQAAQRMRDTGVALTVLPSTDLFLMGREPAQPRTRGVAPAHYFLEQGVNCSLSTNNVLNPFTPFGDCSQLRMANLNANIAQLGTAQGLCECFHMVTSRAARLVNHPGYGVTVGNNADCVVLDAASPEAAVAELAPVLHAFKGGKPTVTRPRPMLHRPMFPPPRCEAVSPA